MISSIVGMIANFGEGVFFLSQFNLLKINARLNLTVLLVIWPSRVLQSWSEQLFHINAIAKWIIWTAIFTVSSFASVSGGSGLDSKPFRCSYCPKEFGHLSSLESHVERIHTNESKHHCEACGRAFSSKSNLTAHKKIHTGWLFYSRGLYTQLLQLNSMQNSAPESLSSKI